MDNRTASEIEASTERLLRDLQNVVRDGEELLRAGVQDLSEKGVAARERLAAALEGARETRRRLEERAVAGAKATDKLVREYPYQIKFVIDSPADCAEVEKWLEDFPEVEALVIAHCAGLKISETAVQLSERNTGTSSIGTFKAFLYMVKVPLAMFMTLLRNR